MKSLFLFAISLVVGATSIYAQMPSERLVLGASTGWYPGVHVGYTVDEKFQFGAQVGFRMQGKVIGEGTDSYVTICPFGKYLFSSGADFNTFALAQLYINPGRFQQINAGGSNNGFLLGAGAQYFPAKNVGLFAQIALVNLPFNTNNDALSFGVMTPSVGIEWYLSAD